MVGLQTGISLAAVAAAFYYSPPWYSNFFLNSARKDIERFSCHPFLPKLFVETPPAADHSAIQGASNNLNKFLSSRFSEGDIDSLSVAVVTSQGSVFEHNYGVIRGNESTTSLHTTSEASYRIASISKLFAVLEGHILAQRGLLSWDDPIEKFFPDFKYRLDGFDPSVPPESRRDTPITLFQLASHMSGLGRDWPSGIARNWPHEVYGGGPPPANGLPFPDHKSFFKAMAEHHLVSQPWVYPSYSNTGTGLLGLALVAANRLGSEDPSKEPETYAELVQRDIFDHMGLNGSHFLTTAANKHQAVVPSLAPELADYDFLDAMNPAGGQFASLTDLITPVHVFEEDDWTQIGVMWEILKAQDSNSRLRRIYWKLGALAGYNSVVAIHPGASYGVAVLMAGQYQDASKLAYTAFEIFQPAMDNVLAEQARALYAGTWTTQDGKSKASIVVDKGTLYIENLLLDDTDILLMFHASERLALRSSGRRDELRLDTGIPGYNGLKHMGCYPYWNGQDLWGVRNNAPINVIYFRGPSANRTLHVPAADIIMTRV